MTYGIPLTRVVAYTYQSDYHCTVCATKRFGEDEHGFVPESAEDSEGNPVGAVFADSFDGEDRTVERCSSCDDLICLSCGDTVSDRVIDAKCSNCGTEWLPHSDEYVTPHAERDYIRTVRLTPYRRGMGPSFTLRMWDTGRREGSHYQLGYDLRKRESGRWELLFTGEDYGCSPMHAIDSNESVRSLLGFLTLRPGDTDREYFDRYTPAQLDFAAQHAESLALESMNRFGEDA